MIILAKWDLGYRRNGSLDRLGCEIIVSLQLIVAAGCFHYVGRSLLSL